MAIVIGRISRLVEVERFTLLLKLAVSSIR
ncbi:hypothetical protein ES707_22069 [subsurface metagenome]